jgi:hypothetical protein
MTNLSKNLVEKIAGEAIRQKYKTLLSNYKLAEQTLAEECYNSVFAKEVLDQVNALPDGWVLTCSCLMFNVGGWNVSLNIGRQVPIPASTHCTRLGVIDGELSDRVKAHMEAVKDAKIKKENEYQKLKAFLGSFKTIKKLRETWPEGAEHYDQYDVQPGKSQVPAVVTQEINAMLNISPEVQP